MRIEDVAGWGKAMAQIKASIAGVLLAVSVAACEPIIERHGFIPSEATLSQITVGQTTRAQALDILPPPTIAGQNAAGSFYYIYNEFRTLGPTARRETEREVLAVDVNGAGIVTGMTRYGLRDGIVVPIVQYVTDDNISDVSFISQLLGGIGQVDASQFLAP